MEKILDTRIKLKKDTQEKWVANNPILLDGEIALITINGEVYMKIGNSDSSYSESLELSVSKADKAVQDGSGNVIADTYVTKAELDRIIANLTSSRFEVADGTDLSNHVWKFNMFANWSEIISNIKIEGGETLLHFSDGSRLRFDWGPWDLYIETSSGESIYIFKYSFDTDEYVLQIDSYTFGSSVEIEDVSSADYITSEEIQTMIDAISA